MDSEHSAGSSSSSAAKKIRVCPYGKRMSSITKDFDTICTICRGIDCDLDNSVIILSLTL